MGRGLQGRWGRRHKAPPGEAPAQLREIKWRPGLAARGHWGGHFGASAAGFIQHKVAAAMGLTPPAPTDEPSG